MIVTPDYFTSEAWYFRRSIIRMNSDSLVMISGGFSPLHMGHLKYIREAKNVRPVKYIRNILVAVVMGNGFLERKKGFYFQDEIERAELVDEFQSVDYTIIWDDGSQYVDGALRLIKPDVFANGGDRSGDSFMPEEELVAAKEVGCALEYGVGGREKTNSSSELLANYKQFLEH